MIRHDPVNCGIYLQAHGGSWPGLRTGRGWRRVELVSSRKWQRAAMASSDWRIMGREVKFWRWHAHDVAVSGQWKMTW